MSNTFELIAGGMALFFSWSNIMALIGGVVIGLVAGSIPGLSSSNTSAIMLPITIAMPMDAALIFIAAIYMSAQYGGSVSAVLINTPGTTGSIATTLDGFPLCKQGKAGYALGLSLGSSTWGGLFSAIVVLLIMRPISVYAMSFGTAELFILSLVGISIIVSISDNDPAKGGLAGCIGLLIAAMPAEPSFGRARLTFGFLELYNTVPMVAAMCGLFAFSSMINMADEKVLISVSDKKEVKVGMRSIIEGVHDAFKYPFNLIRSAFIGLFVGIMPGSGVDAASLLSYSQAKIWSKHPETFGHGEPEGVIAPEAANNAVVAGALVPSMTLGIPGSATAAVMLAALALHGINPGPKVVQNFPNEVYAVFVSILFATILMFLLGLLYTAVCSRISTVNLAFLIPSVLGICIAGAYATRGFIFDVWFFLALGFLGYIMDHNHYPYAPLLLGFVMGSIAEANFTIAMNLSRGSFTIFFATPLAWGIWCLLLLVIILPPLLKHRNKKKLG